jgi:hypothetical protein
MEDFNNFYIGRHKTHRLTWAYGLGNLEIQYLYTKKQYQSVTTLIQYCILTVLEKYEKEFPKMQIGKIAEIIGYNTSFVVNEANALLYHLTFNPKRVKNCGIITTTAPDGQDIKAESEISINREFNCNNLKLSTIPVAFKVI